MLILNNIIIVSYCCAHLDSTDRTKELYEQAWEDYDKGNYMLAQDKLKKIIYLKQLAEYDSVPEYVKVYNRLGLINQELGNLNLSINYYKAALNYNSNKYYQSVINYNIANTYSIKGDYSKALDYFENSLLELHEINDKDKYLNICDIYHNQGFTYYNLGSYELSLEKYLKSIEVAKKHGILNIGVTYQNCGLVYIRMNNMNLAQKYLTTAVEMDISNYGKEHPITNLTRISLAELYVKKKEFTKAKEIFAMVYRNLSNSYSTKHPFIADYFQNKGDMYFAMQNYMLAIKSYQNALISKVEAFNDTGIYTHPSLDALPDIELLDILKNKATAFEKLALKENREKNLLAALNTLELTVGFIEQLRIGYLYESSKLTLSEKESETYESIIRIAYALLNLTSNKKYIDIAFKYSEQSKYAILRESINEEKAINMASIPDSIKQKEHNNKEQIGSVHLQIKQLSEQQTPDSLRLFKLKEKLFQLRHEQEKLTERLEQHYPDYYKSKYRSNTVSIQELQAELTEKEVLLNYELTDSVIYTFIVSKNSYNLNARSIDSVFYKNLKQYQEFLHSFYEYDYSGYRESSYELYKILIEPFKHELKGKSLQIMPDTELSLIAFEALTTEVYSKTKYPNYATEPYLIKNYPVSYLYSATLFAESKQKDKRRNRSLLGFAPDYENSRDSLESMPLSTTYLKRIARFIRGKVFTGEQASEYNFKQNIHKYGIVHLYAHGYENIDDPEFSKMYFSYNEDSIEDGYLYAYEIAELDIKANLIVLASCYSGSGAINKGEGALSIGRSFINAANPSLVTSLWAASYESTLFITKEFYKYIFRGKRIDDAMRMAKLNYLKQANPLEANPRNWANLISIGNQDALFRGYMITGIITIILLSSLLFAFLRKRKMNLRNN